MFFLKFLQGAVDQDDPVMLFFVSEMVPALMEHYSDTSAKGGDQSHKNEYDEQTRREFEEKADQSMLSHQLNGIFPTMRLMRILEGERLGPAPFSDVERRVYILAYLMHDVNKILSIRDLETQTRAAIDEAKAMIADELRKCNADAFLPDWETYLEDIAYLVVNTQERWGTHLNTYGWYPRLPEHRLLELRRLCAYSDCIAYLIPAPSEILWGENAGKVNTILAEMSENQLVFTYHQLREVRGLLTNVMNDGLVNLYKREGVWPYLFFSDGVVYIKRKKLQIAISNEQITQAVHARLRELCASRIRQSAPGFKFDNKGIAKHPEYYFEFLTLEDYAALLARFTVAVTRNDVTAGPLAKLRKMQTDGEIPADIDLSFAPDKRAGKVSRFLSVIFMTLLGNLGKRHDLLRERVEKAVVDHLGLAPYWGQSKAIPNKGGTEYRWFWLGLCYLRDHQDQGITDYEGKGNLLEVFSSTLKLVIDMAGHELRQSMPQKYLFHLSSYLDSVVEVPMNMREGGALPDFAGEMERYANAKNARKKGGKELICTLCNGAYPTDEQSDNAVLFQPWVYKNKLSLYSGKNAGGVCAICAIELMLRQILQKGELHLTGSKFEGLKMKYLAIYPDFFYTAETGKMVQGMVNQLESLNFFTVRRQLDGKDITVRSLMELDVFASPQSNGMTTEQQFVTVEDDEDLGDFDSEEEQDAGSETSQAQSSGDRAYIRYESSNYPGMCFFGVRASKGDTDSASWAMPAFLALALPLITGTKVVISEMILPLFSSGHDFRETVIFDAPHPFLDRLLKTKRVRVNDLLRKIRLLSSLYIINLDTNADRGKPQWQHLSAIARDLDTDPLLLFSYLHEQERRDKRESFRADDAARYLHIYKEILEADVSKIEQCVDLYIVFYRGGGWKSHSILKPVDIVAKAIINSSLNIEEADLLWQMQGELKNWLDRVRGGQATGYAVFHRKEITDLEEPAIREFVLFFYNAVFKEYCQSERGILRSRINQFKDGCEAYYMHLIHQQRIQDQEEDAEAEPTTV
ncbi:MAG TPA: type I-D CRISPR-associated protein Cas10d/Csc3 [Ktedonobacteraceae bacterium]|nr:type I-D CRISPR-associated protein Cas10d/Csc3 [Ktedonobacteraceae bacterium]